MVGPGMFVGRYEELDAIESYLFQTRHENPQNFLIQGERGIGKSSLFLFVDLLASGEIPPTGSTEKFNFLVVNADLGGCATQLEIIQKIAGELKQAISDREHLKKLAKDVWDWFTNWEVLGVRYNKDRQDLDADLISREFIDKISVLCLRDPDLHGILILVDEADRPPADANLGETLKMFSERLERKGCSKVLFGVAGLPTIIAKLRESHDSSPRLFHTMPLRPLEVEERKKVVNLGIERANEKNAEQTTVEPDALHYIAELSEGYPHFIQQFAYSAFEKDIDNNITIEDVKAGSYGERGALAQLGDKYFHEMYIARVSSPDYRRVLDAMAQHGDDWIVKRDIIQESGVQESTVTNALNALKTKEIILTDESRRGYYRLPTRSFAAWINANNETSDPA